VAYQLQKFPRQPTPFTRAHFIANRGRQRLVGNDLFLGPGAQKLDDAKQSFHAWMILNLHLVGGLIPSEKDGLRQLGTYVPIYGKIKAIIQTTNQSYMGVSLVMGVPQ
jgi:hypothetical protein